MGILSPNMFLNRLILAELAMVELVNAVYSVLNKLLKDFRLSLNLLRSVVRAI